MFVHLLFRGAIRNSKAFAQSINMVARALSRGLCQKLSMNASECPPDQHLVHPGKTWKSRHSTEHGCTLLPWPPYERRQERSGLVTLPPLAKHLRYPVGQPDGLLQTRSMVTVGSSSRLQLLPWLWNTRQHDAVPSLQEDASPLFQLHNLPFSTCTHLPMPCPSFLASLLQKPAPESGLWPGLKQSTTSSRGGAAELQKVTPRHLTWKKSNHEPREQDEAQESSHGFTHQHHQMSKGHLKECEKLPSTPFPRDRRTPTQKDLEKRQTGKQQVSWMRLFFVLCSTKVTRKQVTIRHRPTRVHKLVETSV